MKVQVLPNPLARHRSTSQLHSSTSPSWAIQPNSPATALQQDGSQSLTRQDVVVVGQARATWGNLDGASKAKQRTSDLRTHLSLWAVQAVVSSPTPKEVQVIRMVSLANKRPARRVLGQYWLPSRPERERQKPGLTPGPSTSKTGVVVGWNSENRAKICYALNAIRTRFTSLQRASLVNYVSGVSG